MRLGESQALMGRGRGISDTPTLLCQTTGPILDLKTTFDSPGHELSKHVVKYNLKIADDVTGQVKGQRFDNHLNHHKVSVSN